MNQQYEIVIANLDPTVGSEMQKTRPCVIVSPNEMNENIKTRIICPITSHSKDYPSRVRFELEGKTNWIAVDQIRTIDQSRIHKTIGGLEEESIEELKAVFQEIFID